MICPLCKSEMEIIILDFSFIKNGGYPKEMFEGIKRQKMGNGNNEMRVYKQTKILNKTGIANAQKMWACKNCSFAKSI